MEFIRKLLLLANAQWIDERYSGLLDSGRLPSLLHGTVHAAKASAIFFLHGQLRCELRLPDRLDLIELLDADSQTRGFLNAGRANGHVREIRVHEVSRLSGF